MTDQPRIRLREIVERDWDGQASPGSAGYRLTRMFREEVSEAIIAFVLVECDEADADVRLSQRARGAKDRSGSSSRRSRCTCSIRSTQSWDALLLHAATDVVVRAEREGGSAEPWSTWNITAYRHPLSAGLPLVGRWLDMPLQPLPGDLYTPQHALECVGLVRADDRLARVTKAKGSCTCRRARADIRSRPSIRTHTGVGQRRRHAVSARAGGLHVDVDAVIQNAIVKMRFCGIAFRYCFRLPITAPAG